VDLSVRVVGVGGGGAGGAVAHLEEPVALDVDVQSVTGGLLGAGAHEVVDGSDAHAETDLLGVGAAVEPIGAGGGAEVLRQLVHEGGPLCLVADGVDVGQVVGGHV